jgi:signal transduction histidine kinase
MEAVKSARRANQAIEQRVEEQARAIEEQLLAAAQATAILEERQRLARDLHDSVTQALYGITLHAEVARRLLVSGDMATAAGYLGALQETAQEALAEMRLLIFDLRPPILGQVGLAAALQVRLDAVEGRANLQTQLIVDAVGDLPAPVEQALYGIAREALNNALKHAHAQHITVHLRQTQAAVILEVADDGSGFDPAMARANGGQGLRGIDERVAQVKGQLTLRSALGAGTQLRVEVPL